MTWLRAVLRWEECSFVRDEDAHAPDDEQTRIVQVGHSTCGCGLLR